MGGTFSCDLSGGLNPKFNHDHFDSDRVPSHLRQTLFMIRPCDSWYLVDPARPPGKYCLPGKYWLRILFGQQGVEVMADDVSDMYELIAAHLLSGRVVLVLGANLGERRLRENIGDVSENVVNRDGRLRLIQQRLMDLVDIGDPHHCSSTCMQSDFTVANRLAALSPQFVGVNYGPSPAR